MASELRRVCVIGAGLGGLVSLKSLLPFTNELTVVAYEQSNRVGGLWIYADPCKPTNMYKNLRTNLPKEVMMIPGCPFPESMYQSFIGHADYLNYLEDLAGKLNLYDHIKFRTEVTSVTEKGSGSNATYEVETKDLESDTVSKETFDSVFVCIGHYNVPMVPDIPGQDTFTGKMMHSVDYREPELFKNQTVLVLGARSSGVDLSIDISEHAMKVFLSHNNPKSETWFPDNVEQISGISRIDGRDIHLNDGSQVTADIILLATGYRYEFPCLEKSCQPKTDNQHLTLTRLYRDIVDIDHPSIYYIGLNKIIAPAPQLHAQCEYAAALVTGRICLPGREEMEKHLAETYDKRVTQRSGVERYYNIHEALQWEYNSDLLAAAGKPGVGTVQNKIYIHVSALRRWNAKAYRQAVYRIVNDDQFEILNLPENAPDSFLLG